MNKQTLLREIADSVQKKHPWKISQARYVELFHELHRAFIEEREHYDRLLEKAKQFTLCNLVLTQVKIEVKLTLDELIVYELSLDKWNDVKTYDILPGDIKKILKDKC